MEGELKEIGDFIKQVPPFDSLSSAKISPLVRHIEIDYQRKGTSLSLQKQHSNNEDMELRQL